MTRQELPFFIIGVILGIIGVYIIVHYTMQGWYF